MKHHVFVRANNTYLFCILAIVFSLMGIRGNAQQASKFSADFSIGPSIPLGEFADKNYSGNPEAGLAKLGFSMYANLKYAMSKHIGITLAMESSFNKQDPDAFAKFINYGNANPGPVQITTEYWRLFKLLTGPYYQGYFTNHRLSYFINILAGVSKTTVPSHSWSVYNQSGVFLGQESQNSMPLPWSFAYQAGAGLQYDSKNGIYLLLSADYFNSSSLLPVYNLVYDFGSINIMFGMGFRF